jgi:hypothetical protein
VSLERPDSITASAVSAREDIGRAVADRIREVDDAHELKKVAEDVLPQLEKFLESPEERRLRRIRAGVIVAASGVGSAIVGLIMSEVLRVADAEAAMMVSGLGIVAFAIGLGLVLNGLLFTRQRTQLEDQSSEARSQNLLDRDYVAPQLNSGTQARAQTTSNLAQSPTSVTEQTTLHLKSDR